jgi:hypothetical protein
MVLVTVRLSTYPRPRTFAFAPGTFQRALPRPGFRPASLSRAPLQERIEPRALARTNAPREKKGGCRFIRRTRKLVGLKAALHPTMNRRRASTPCPQARIRTSQNGGVTSAYCAASVRRGFLVCQSGVSNLQCDLMTCNALHYAASRTLSHRQASCLRRIARATGRPRRWCASMPWSSGSRPCCAGSISCNLLCKTSMAHSVMSRKSVLIGSHRCRDNSPMR